MSFRRLLAWWAGLLATFSGCVHVAATPTGVIVPQPHTSIRVKQAITNRQGSIARGQTREVRVTLTRPIGNGTLMLNRWVNNSHHQIPMHDDGRNGDRIANDGEWYAAYTVAGTDSGQLEDWVSLSFPGQFGNVGNHERADLPDLWVAQEETGDE